MPVAGNCDGATSALGNSQEKTTCEPSASRLKLIVLTVPSTGRCSLDLHVADMLQVDQRSVQLAAVAVRRELDGIEAVLALETRVARLLACPEAAAEECLEGCVPDGAKWPGNWKSWCGAR